MAHQRGYQPEMSGSVESRGGHLGIGRKGRGSRKRRDVVVVVRLNGDRPVATGAKEARPRGLSPAMIVVIIE